MFDAPHERFAGKMVSDDLFGFSLVLVVCLRSGLGLGCISKNGLNFTKVLEKLWLRNFS